jgi:hypothetical protein
VALTQFKRSKLPYLPPRLTPMPKTGKPFYSSPVWRDLLARIIAARGRACERCGARRAENGAPIVIYGDHKVEIQDGGAPLDPLNIQLLCPPCHGKKTAEHRAARRR